MGNLPVLVLGYNRPNLLADLFERLRPQKPKKIFVAIDGPRRNVPNDSELVEQSRKSLELIDWPSDTFTLFRDANLGCGLAVSEAISWFFENVDEGIILEDDVRPTEDFFQYARDLTNRYRKDPRVISISGANTVPPHRQGRSDSYRFSRIPQVWGWATWRDRWSDYTLDIHGWQENWRLRDRWTAMGSSIEAYLAWTRNFDRVASKDLDTWDFQLVYLAMRSQRLTTIPRYSLVSNVGFGPTATHLRDERPSPLVFGPATIRNWSSQTLIPDARADTWMMRHVYGYSIAAQIARRLSPRKTEVR